MAKTSPVYVRSEMIPQQKPPISQVGAVRWMRENLFSGPLNTILTLVSLYAVYFIVTLIGPWLLRSVWDASSLSECRQIAAAKYGEGVEGACFALIRERWNQLLFGFYPRELYWRPVLTFILMLVALAPVLFSALPRKMLWFSAIYPAVGFWLLWGGSIWLPISIVVGLAATGYIGMFLAARTGMLIGSLVAVAAFILIFFTPLRASFESVMETILPFAITKLQSDDMGGFMLSLTIGISGIVFSLPIGILLALGRQSDMPLVKMICVGFIEIIRGVPLITLLFTASLLLNYFLPPGTNFDIILRVIIMVTLFAAAYMAEVIRGGLAALPRGQYEAADALGLTYWQAQQHIIMPQALKVSIPNIVSNFIGLFKDTTLVIFIGLLDPLALVSAIRADTAWSGTYWEPIIFVGALFFIVCFSMSRYSMYLENKLKTDHR
jgi:general L-amino acid transport system permease protein